MRCRHRPCFTGFPEGPVRHCYLHHDGYPTGAAWRFANALWERPAAAELLAAFLRSQPGAEALADPELTVQGWRSSSSAFCPEGSMATERRVRDAKRMVLRCKTSW
jgi:hypothetical protein